MDWLGSLILGYIVGAIITFVLVLVEMKMEERPGVSQANTMGIFMMTPFWPFMLGGWIWRRFVKDAG